MGNTKHSLEPETDRTAVLAAARNDGFSLLGLAAERARKVERLHGRAHPLYTTALAVVDRCREEFLAIDREWHASLDSDEDSAAALDAANAVEQAARAAAIVAPAPARRTMSLADARHVLSEFPDADLSPFRIVGEDGIERDGDLIAMDEANRNLDRIFRRIASARVE